MRDERADRRDRDIEIDGKEWLPSRATGVKSLIGSYGTPLNRATAE